MASLDNISVPTEVRPSGGVTTPNLEFTLPLPPSINHVYVTTRSGRRVLGKQGKEYMDGVRMLLGTLVGEPFSKVESITYRFYWPNLLRRDADNFLKVLRDCFTGVVVTDDNWKVIPEEHVYSELGKDDPRVVVTFSGGSW